MRHKEGVYKLPKLEGIKKRYFKQREQIAYMNAGANNLSTIKYSDVQVSVSEMDWLIKQAEKLQMIEKEWRYGTGESIDESLAESFE
jgi:hypothetical protein